MKYQIEFKLKAVKDLKALQKKQAQQILEKIELMSTDLAGNVKKLTNYSPEYRLRVGSFRVLFEVEEDRIIIYRILHRKEAYK